MAIRTLYTKYFQKSKVFLYPQLGFPRGMKHKPIETYTFWDESKDNAFSLYCRFKGGDSVAFRKFEIEKLGPHPLVRDYSVLEDGSLLYVFDFEEMAEDFLRFVDGKYSKLSEPFKKKIVDFFKTDKVIIDYVESYLYPEYYYDDYSRLLDVSEESLRKVGELCDKPDFKKETLTLKAKQRVL